MSATTDVGSDTPWANSSGGRRLPARLRRRRPLHSPWGELPLEILRLRVERPIR